MIIEFGAFNNCTSLKEIHLEKCDFSVNTNIYNCNTPKNLQIIVNDKVYKKSLETEIPANHKNLKLYSEYIKDKLHKIKHVNIIESIIYIDMFTQMYNKTEVLQVLRSIVQILKQKYHISDDNIDYVKFQIGKIGKIKNGS